MRPSGLAATAGLFIFPARPKALPWFSGGSNSCGKPSATARSVSRPRPESCSRPPWQSASLALRIPARIGDNVRAAGSGSKNLPPRRQGIFDFGEAAFERLHRLQQSHQSALADRLDYQAIAVTVHDRLVARQFELHGNTDRLVAAVTE